MKQPKRRRQGVTPTLQAMLDDFEAWKRDTGIIELDAEGGTVPTRRYRFDYIWVGPDGKPREITLEMMHGQGNNGLEGPDAWPRAGLYRIYVLDENDVEVTDMPWEGEHFTRDSLMQMGRPEEAPARLFASMCEDSRIHISNQRATINQYERDIAKMRDDIRTLQAQNVEMTRQAALKDIAVAASKGAEERAIAIRDEAIAELNELREDLEHLHPQIEMGVDALVRKAGQYLGFELPASSNGTQHGNAAADPPPPGAEDPAAHEAAFVGILFDFDKCRECVQRGILSWETVRVLQYVASGRDPGAVPHWDEWAAEAAAANQKGSA